MPLLTANNSINDVLPASDAAANTDGSLYVANSLALHLETFPCVRHQQVFLTGFFRSCFDRVLTIPILHSASVQQMFDVNVTTFHDAFLASCRRFLHCIDIADTQARCPHPFRITAAATQFPRLSGQHVEQCRQSSCPLTLHRHLPLESQPVVYQSAVVSRPCRCRLRPFGMASLSRFWPCRPRFLPFALSVELGLVLRPIDRYRSHLLA